MKNGIRVVLALAVLIVASLACNLGKQEMSLTNLRMAYDSDGINQTSIFSPADVFFAVGDLNNAPEGTVVSAQWRAVEIEEYAPDELIYEQEINDFTDESFEGTIYFQLSNDADWLPGEYQVDLLLNGALIDTLFFSVQ